MGGPPPSNVTDFPPGSVWIQLKQLDFKMTGATKTITATAADNLVHAAAHGFVANDMVQFGVLSGGQPLQSGTRYYVIATGLTAADFSVSETQGGPAVDITANATAGKVSKVVADTGPDAGKSFQMNVWSSLLPNSIDWGDNSIDAPQAWDYAPSGGAPGAVSIPHTYTGRGGTQYRIVVEAGGVRLRANALSGSMVVVDDVSRDGVERPPTDDQNSVFKERQKVLVSVRKQMGAMPPITGGPVN
jgi:hypothetical protein